MVVGLLVSLWIARYLGPRQFGILSYANAFVALFATIASLGLEAVVVRDIVRNPGSTNEILGSAFLLRVAGGLLTVFLAFVCASLMRPEDAFVQLLIVIIAAGTIVQAFDSIDYLFQAEIQSKYSVAAKNLAFLITALLKILFVILMAPLLHLHWQVWLSLYSVQLD